MRENLDRSGSSSLAVVEKRQHRPGGCSGVFFQLFDWNRKFAKKLLFSKKVLPSASHSKQKRRLQKLQATKLLQTVNEDGKLSLDVVRSDELQRCRMQVPSLLPRLMGLESIPIVKRGKNKKDVKGNSCSEFGGTEKLFDRKREAFERRAMARLGSEAIHLKSTLSRKNHIKLPTPSTSFPSRKASSKWHNGRGASKLIDAAARILEPGLQSKTRTKHAFICPNYVNQYTPSLENKTRIPLRDEGRLSALVCQRGHVLPKMEMDGICSSISGFQERGGAERFIPLPAVDDVPTGFLARNHPFGATTTSSSSKTCFNHVGGLTHYSSEDCYAGGESVQRGAKVEGRFCCRVNDIPAVVGNMAQRTVMRNTGNCYSKKEASERGGRGRFLGLKGSAGHSGGTSGELKEGEIFTCENEWKMGDSRSLSEDTLSMFLQRKLRELNREEACLMEGGIPKTPITMILQEIIHVLTKEQHFLQEHELSRYSRLSACASSSDFDIATLREEVSSLPESVAECMHLSPGSVLEASFSNDSCFTNSFGDVGDLRQTEQQQQQYSDVGADLEVARMIDSISMLESTIPSRNNSSLDHMISTIVRSEFLVGNEEHGLLFPFLLDRLKALTAGNEEESGLVFDSLLECLDMYCLSCPMLGVRLWSRLMSCEGGAEGLVREVYREMRKWGGAREVGAGDRPWTRSGLEIYETASYVSDEVIDGLVEEMLLEVW